MKNYEKPIASFLAFYSEKDIASVQDLDKYAGGAAGGSLPALSADTGVGGEIGDDVE